MDSSAVSGSELTTMRFRGTTLGLQKESKCVFGMGLLFSLRTTDDFRGFAVGRRWDVSVFVTTLGWFASEQEERIMSICGIRSRRASFSVFAVCLFFVLFALTAGVSMAQQGNPEGEIVNVNGLPPVLTGPYRIQVGDVLDIAFFKTVDLNQTRTVGPDGEIYLPIVGRVDVVGRTVDDVTKEISEGYLKEMVNPQITVSVAEYSGLQVYVSGEVNTPGIQDYRGGLTLVQAISNAGGFNRRARIREVLLIRPGPDNKPVGAIIDVKEILRKGQIVNDVPLAPLDIVYVHHKKIVNLNIFVEQYLSDNIPNLKGWGWLYGAWNE
jgi:protein involved in polysaccharide export with SLBB domain